MPSMDQACFLGPDTSRVNFISVTTTERYTFAQAKERARKFMLQKPKLRWSIVEILGDYYWKDNNVDEMIEKSMIKID